MEESVDLACADRAGDASEDKKSCPLETAETGIATEDPDSFEKQIVKMVKMEIKEEPVEMEKNCIIKAPEVVDVPDEDEVQKTFEMIDLTQEQHVCDNCGRQILLIHRGIQCEDVESNCMETQTIE